MCVVVVEERDWEKAGRGRERDEKHRGEGEGVTWVGWACWYLVLEHIRDLSMLVTVPPTTAYRTRTCRGGSRASH